MIDCTCGYQADSRNDFEQHVLASMHSDEDHFETRKNGGGMHDALRRSAREAHAEGKITRDDLADRLHRISFMERQTR